MKHHIRHIISLLFILLLVGMSTLRYVNRVWASEILSQNEFTNSHCKSRDIKKWRPPRRKLCGTGIYLNHDDAISLGYLPTIGPKRAHAIVEYRKKHGPFRRLKELENIKGIGPVSVMKIKPWIEDVPE